MDLEMKNPMPQVDCESNGKSLLSLLQVITTTGTTGSTGTVL
jgi:hypothetical protein